MDRTLLGARRNSTAVGVFFTGVMRDARIYNRAVVSAEWKEHLNPARRYELWYPLRSRKWFSVAAASLPTLSASTYKPGTLTTDGWQPRVTAS